MAHSCSAAGTVERVPSGRSLATNVGSVIVQSGEFPAVIRPVMLPPLGLLTDNKVEDLEGGLFVWKVATYAGGFRKRAFNDSIMLVV
jgi:hypothetical protein